MSFIGRQSVRGGVRAGSLAGLCISGVLIGAPASVADPASSVATQPIPQEGARSASLLVCPEEPPLENFTITGQEVSVPGFAQGEECAVILDAPASDYPIEIVKVRIGWSSPGGGLPDSLEDAIRIYPAGLPSPGAFQYEVLGPLLVDGAINEFDLTTVTGATGSRIVSGGPFTVSLRIANTEQPGDPAPIHDGNGCQPGKNAILVNGATWVDACLLGVSGDWEMSVVYRRVNCGAIVDCNNNGVDDAIEIATDPSLDCDLDGVLDSCQIAADPTLDANNNGVLDSCEPPPACNGDLNNDGVVDGVDLAIVLNQFGPCASGGCTGDASQDGVVDGVDLAIVLNQFGPCAP